MRWIETTTNEYNNTVVYKLTENGKGECYEELKELLGKFNMDRRPKYTGHGVEIYEPENDRTSNMIVDWAHYIVTIRLPLGYEVSKLSAHLDSV